MRVLAGILAVPLVVLVWQWWHDGSTERTLAPIASQIAGRDVAVDCQTFWGALIDPLPRHGEVVFDRNGVPERRIFLTHDTCKRLAAFARSEHHEELDCLDRASWSASRSGPFGDGCYRAASETVYAILTLAHEAYHTAGIRDEAVANCYATQAMGFAALRLGAPEAEARAVAAAMAALLPFQGDAYRTTECVPGSRYDLHPDTPAFPTEDFPVAPLGRGGTKGLAAAA